MGDFYENKIGLKSLSRENGFIDYNAGSCRLALHQTVNPEAGKTKICFYSEDVSKTRAELISRGVKMGKEPDKDHELKLCDGKDPEGNVFQISNRE